MARLDPQLDHWFCAARDCPVVYWWPGGRFVAPDVRVPVFQKDPAGSVPVCYCFGFTRAMVERDAERVGRPTVLEAIKQHVAAGRCACELQNPQGACCLGNVAGVASDAVSKKPARTQP